MKVIVKGEDGFDLEFDTKNVTVLVMLTAYDTDKIRALPKGSGSNYCVHPSNKNGKEVQEWMQQRISQIFKEEESEKLKRGFELKDSPETSIH